MSKLKEDKFQDMAWELPEGQTHYMVCHGETTHTDLEREYCPICQRVSDDYEKTILKGERNRIIAELKAEIKDKFIKETRLIAMPPGSGYEDRSKTVNLGELIKLIEKI